MLCQNCSGLDLDAAFAGKHELEHGFIASTHDPGAAWEWKPSLCCDFCSFVRLCCQLSTSKYSSDDGPIETEPRWLRRNRRTASFQFKESEPILELVFADPWFDSLPEPNDDSWVPRLIFGRTAPDVSDSFSSSSGHIRVVPPLVDVTGTLKNWIKICEETHKSPSCSDDFEVPLLVPIRVLDCRTRQVITAPEHCQYVALSYVWGQQKTESLILGGGSVSSYPQTIEDAIYVTLDLGLQYLWVDKYCIIQDDKIDVGNQVKQMDLVYRNAKVTLIAAAGKSSDYGLAGVSVARQNQQARVTFNGISLASFSHYPWDPLWGSPWNSRGWTYQECYFSRRRIYFTEHQAIYDCSCEWECEAVTSPQRTRNVQTNFGFWDSGYPGFTVYDRIKDYSARQLTFTDDIINAFSGILRAFETLQSPVRHHWGVPLLLGKDLLDSFILGLSWEFRTATRARRREGFPSWSWTGWEGPLHYRYWVSPGHTYLSQHDISISVEFGDGSIFSWPEFKEALCQTRHASHLSMFIKLEAWTARVKLQYYEHGDVRDTPWPRKVLAIIGHEEHRVSLSDANGPAVYGSQSVYECTGILLLSLDTSEDYSFHPLLLVTQREGYWERVGIIDLREFIEQMTITDISEDSLEEWKRSRLKLERRELRLG